MWLTSEDFPTFGWIYLKKYRIDEKLYGQIIGDLKERGEISED